MGAHYHDSDRLLPSDAALIEYRKIRRRLRDEVSSNRRVEVSRDAD